MGYGELRREEEGTASARDGVIEYFDSHCHLTDAAFRDDREAVFRRAREAGVTRLTLIASSVDDAVRAADLAVDREGVFSTVGVHPHAVSESKPKVHVASPGEVEAIVHFSLAELLSDVVWREEIWTWQGATPRALSFFEVPGDTIWGATGSMLRQLLAIATGTDDSILGGPG